ncbi:hypothetical protein BGZ68_008286 [Mortierella alpina]|nr:hypothetical protein BGZ68_008286 [Mortierella alpina]
MLKYVLVASMFAAAVSARQLLTTCNNRDFGGSCILWHGEVKTCYSLNEYKHSISSADVHGGVHCVLYPNDDCTGAGPIISGPARNLEEQNFNDKAVAYYCFFP